MNTHSEKDVEKVKHYVDLARKAIQSDDPAREREDDDFFRTLNESEKSIAQGWLFAIFARPNGKEMHGD